MAKKKKFRCYVEFHARISTDIMATDKETAKAEIDKIDLSDAVKKFARRKWSCWQLNGGCTKVKEVVTVKREIEQ